MAQDEVEYKCWCGNDATLAAFYPVNADGMEVEPDSKWGGFYRCAKCRQLVTISDNKVFVVYDPDTVARDFARVTVYEHNGTDLIDNPELDMLAANVEMRMGEWGEFGAPDERAAHGIYVMRVTTEQGVGGDWFDTIQLANGELVVITDDQVGVYLNTAAWLAGLGELTERWHRNDTGLGSHKHGV